LNRNEHVDALVIGAGIAGCASAHHLLSAGCEVAVLHQVDDVQRTESVPPHAARALQTLTSAQGQPFTEVVAWWGSDSPSRIPCLGARAIQRNALATQLRAAIQEKGARFITGSSSLVIERSNRHWLVSYQAAGANGVTKTPWIVDATGRAAAVARLLDARRHAADNLCCLSSPASCPHEAGVWTESTPEGWWNLCSDGAEATLSFFSTTEIIRGIRAQFSSHFANTTHLSVLTRPIGPPRARACGSSLLRPCAGAGWLAVGDAAMAFQPLASAGIANALADGEKVHQALQHPVAYDSAHQKHFRDYLVQLASQYQGEDRWRSSSFWAKVRFHPASLRLPAAFPTRKIRQAAL